MAEVMFKAECVQSYNERTKEVGRGGEIINERDNGNAATQWQWREF